MKLHQLNYHLPKHLIAQNPAGPRDHSKLLALDRNSGKISHYIFYQLVDLLTENDVLVFNKTKVFPARLIGKKDSGGNVEVLLLKQLSGKVWEGIYKSKVTAGQTLLFNSLVGKVIAKFGNSIKIEFNLKGNDFWKMLEKYGKTPIPPYINSTLAENELRNKYQTVYAKDVGSAAAPTAGFHFTTTLLKKLEENGLQMEYVTLHVGLGTFLPIKEDTIEDHQIHEEYFNIDPKTIKRLNDAKQSGKRIIAVGTTTTRVLETLATTSGDLRVDTFSGSTGLFIYPPYKYQFTDALITNFHLPKSTLLALVSAFVSFPNTRHKFISFQESVVGIAYEKAIAKKYRFYSFGDACFIY